MSRTVTITSKSLAKELDKWHITNHNPLADKHTETSDEEVFDKPAFEKALMQASRKTSQPDVETKET